MEHNMWVEVREPVRDPKRFSMYTHRVRCSCGYRSTWQHEWRVEEMRESHLKREGVAS